MIVNVLITRIIRQIYGEKPSDDATITKNLVKTYLPEAIAQAVKTSAKENLQIEGIQYVNNSFYTTFKELQISPEGTIQGDYKCKLPSIPIALGRNEGIASVKLQDAVRTSVPLYMMSADGIDYMDKMPKPKGTPCWNEGSTLFFRSPKLNIEDYTAVVRMVSGGNMEMDSEINISDEWLPMISIYIRDALLASRKVQTDVSNDGLDKI